MTSDRSFSKSMRQDFRREIVWFILYCLAFFFAVPVAYLLGLGDYRLKGVIDAAARMRLHIELYQYTIRQLATGTGAVLLQFFAFAEAYHSFGYLHRKTETDFVHSLPQTRKEIFFSHFVNGLKTVLIPYAACTALGVVISFMTGLSAGEVLWPCVLGMLVNALLFVLTYALSVNAVMLTGNAFTGICGMLVLYFYFPALAGLIDSAMSSWFRTYAGNSGILFTILSEITPFTSVAGLNTAISEDGLVKNTFVPAYGAIGIRAAIVLAVAILLVFTAYLLYKKRALERYGEAMAFPKTEGVIRNLLAVMAALAGMEFFHSIRGGFGWAEFGAVCGVVISFLIIEMIYRRDIRRVFRHKWQLLLLAAGAVLLTLALRNDWFGYDRYLPAREKIESVTYEDGRGGGSIGVEYVTAGNDNFWAGDGRTQEMLLPEAMSGEESIDAAYDLAKAGIMQALKMRRGEDESVVSYYYDNVTKPVTVEDVKRAPMDKAQYTMSCTVTWRLSSGRTVKRSYNIPVMENVRAIEALYRDPAVKKQIFPVLGLTDGMIGRIVYDEMGYETPVTENEAKVREFLAAYREDAAAATAEELMADPSALLLFFTTPEGDAALHRSNRWIKEQFENTESYLCYPLYPSFTATKEVLAGCGVTEGEGRKALLDEAVAKGRTWTIYEGASEILPEGASGVIGPYEAEILKDYIVPSEYSEYGLGYMNTYLPMDLEGVTVGRRDMEMPVLIEWTPETQALMEELLRAAKED